MVSQPHISGYDFPEDGVDTITDSVNYHEDPEAFAVWRDGGEVSREAQGLDSAEQVARRAVVMLAILFVAALFWGPRHCR